MATPLDGIWELIRAEMNGEASPELVELGVELELTAAGGYLVRFAGQVADRGTFGLTEDLIGGVKTLVLHGLEGPNAGRTMPCIYQQVGERLRVCYGLGGVRPASFATAPADQFYLATYRRATGHGTQ